MVRIRWMCGMQMGLLCIPAEHCDWETRSRLLCSGEAIHLVDVSAGDSQCGVVLADCSLVQTFTQAIHFPSGLWYSPIRRTPNWSAFALRVFSAICAMASAGQHQVLVKVHESCHVMLLLSDELMHCLLAGE
jgi:hypothetical protein